MLRLAARIGPAGDHNLRNITAIVTIMGPLVQFFSTLYIRNYISDFHDNATTLLLIHHLASLYRALDDGDILGYPI